MKTQLTKRILGIVLCLAMLMTYMPTVILAAEGDVASVTTAEGTQTYADLASAFAAAAQAENSVLTLLADTATSSVYVDGGKFTVDLNGKTWTANSRALVIVGADMLITDSTADGQGKIVGTGGDIIMLGDGTKLEIAGGTVENTADFCIDTQNNGHPTDAQFTLSGGKLITAGWSAIKVDCASVTIKGGKIETQGDSEFHGDDHDYRSGLLDFSQHPDPTGIAVLNYAGKEIIPGDTTIKLPAGYCFYEQRENKPVAALPANDYVSCIIGKAPVCTHTGGTATCTTLAVCDTCGESYGELDPNNHEYEMNNGICCDTYQPATLVTNENYESFYLKADYVGYYAISNAGQLFWFAQQVNEEGNKEIKGVLTADIELEKRPWTPIGAMGAENSFRGIFDGRNYIIWGLYVEGSENGVGFFSEVRTGTVKNFTIYGNVVVNNEVDYVGGVIGSICGVNGETDLERNGAIVQNITSNVSITVKAHGVGTVGGLVGHADHQSLIEQCVWNGTFNAGSYRVDSGAGGFIGKIQENTGEVTIRNCGAYGTIKTGYEKNSYNNYPTIYMGGFLSFSNTGAKTVIENCLFAGRFERGANLTDEAELAAFGTLRSVKAIKNCYYLGDDGLAAVHSDSPLKPGSDNVEITSVTEDDLRNGTIAIRLGKYWSQGEDYPRPKDTGGHSHSYTYTDNGDGTHDQVCRVCDYVEVDDEAHNDDPTTTYTDNGNGTHSFKCAKCGADVTETHTFTDGACTGCGVIGGYCGEEGNEQNVIWTYANGTLTISGTGAMADQFDNYNNRPWEEYVDQITTIVVNEGITTIGEYAFCGFQQLTTAKLPDSLTTISRIAFGGCRALKTVNLPTNLKTIEGWAFQGCYALESVTLPEGLTTVDKYAFSECINLTSVSVPASVTTIDERAFGLSPARITVAEDNLNYSSDEHGVLFDKGKTTLMYCRPNIEVETYTIPSTVTKICQSAFFECKNLITIIIPEGVTTIGESAFSECTALTTITIPAGVTTIEFNTFSGCTSLTTVTIPAGVTTINQWAFSNCTALTTVTIPTGVTTIEAGAFSGCTALTTVNVPCKWDGSLYTFDESVTVNKVHNWANGTCTACGESCTHSVFDATTGKCVCGFEMAAASTTAAGTTTYYLTIQEALDAAAPVTGATVTLLRSDENVTGLTLIGGNVTLNMNGMILKGSVAENGILQLSGANLTVTGNGTIENTVGYGIYSAYNETTRLYGKITLENGSVIGGIGIYTAKSHVTVVSGAVIGTEYGIFAKAQGAITLEGGTIRGDVGLGTLLNAGVIYLGEIGSTGPTIYGKTCGIDTRADVMAYSGAVICPEGIGIKLGERYNGPNDVIGAGLHLSCPLTIEAATDIYLDYLESLVEAYFILVNIELSDGAYSVDCQQEREVIARPGEGITLKRTWFTSTHPEKFVQYGMHGYLTLAPCAHSEKRGVQNADGATHDVFCEICYNAVEEDVACTGGTATCTDKAVCSVCGEQYGELVADNHRISSATGACACGLKMAAACISADGTVTYYETLAEALQNIQDAVTLRLYQDGSAEYVTLPAGMTLDLNGYTLTADYFTCFGTVADGQLGGVGLLKAAEGIHIAQVGSFLPIYDSASSGYRFYQYELQNLGSKLDASKPNAVIFGFRLNLANTNGYSVLATTSDETVDLLAYIQWGEMPAPIAYQFKDTTLRSYAAQVAQDIADKGSSAKAIMLTLTGTNKLDPGTPVNVSYALSSVTGITAKTDSKSYAVQ